MQIEESSAASAYQVVPYVQELQRCQYFYQIIAGLFGNAVGTNTVQFSTVFTNAMRVIPTFGESGSVQVTNGFGGTSVQSSPSIFTLTYNVNGGALYMGNFSGLTSQMPYFMYLSGNVQWVTMDAELY